MMDRAHTVCTAARCRLRAAVMSAGLLALVACCGCVVAPDGWPPDGDSLDETLYAPQRSGQSACRGGHGGTCCRSIPDPQWLRSGDQCADVCVDECVVDEVFVDDDCGGECYLSGESGDGWPDFPDVEDGCDSVQCGSTCDEPPYQSECNHDGKCGSGLRKWYEPEAGIFNFCVPPATVGAPPPPPPGRFFPVPTRPVFAPRGAPVVPAPPAM